MRPCQCDLVRRLILFPEAPWRRAVAMNVMRASDVWQARARWRNASALAIAVLFGLLTALMGGVYWTRGGVILGLSTAAVLGGMAVAVGLSAGQRLQVDGDRLFVRRSVTHYIIELQDIERIDVQNRGAWTSPVVRLRCGEAVRLAPIEEMGRAPASRAIALWERVS